MELNTSSNENETDIGITNPFIGTVFEIGCQEFAARKSDRIASRRACSCHSRPKKVEKMFNNDIGRIQKHDNNSAEKSSEIEFLESNERNFTRDDSSDVNLAKSRVDAINSGGNRNSEVSFELDLTAKLSVELDSGECLDENDSAEHTREIQIRKLSLQKPVVQLDCFKQVRNTSRQNHSLSLKGHIDDVLISQVKINNSLNGFSKKHVTHNNIFLDDDEPLLNYVKRVKTSYLSKEYTPRTSRLDESSDEDLPLSTFVKRKPGFTLSDDVYRCDTCGKTFKRHAAIAAHVKWHQEVNTTGTKGSDSEEDKTDSNSSDEADDNVCPICFRQFHTNHQMQKHKQKYHVKVHRYKPKPKFYQCETCGMMLKGKGPFDYHVLIHKPPAYKCGICGHAARHRRGLKQHEKVHTNYKPHICKTCGRCFRKPYQLRAHHRLHTGEKPYKCPTCGCAFSRSCALKRHRNQHTGFRPYKCEVCSLHFTQKQVLYKHWKQHPNYLPGALDTRPAYRARQHVCTVQPFDTNSESDSTTDQMICKDVVNGVVQSNIEDSVHGARMYKENCKSSEIHLAQHPEARHVSPIKWHQEVSDDRVTSGSEDKAQDYTTDDSFSLFECAICTKQFHTKHHLECHHRQIHNPSFNPCDPIALDTRLMYWARQLNSSEQSFDKDTEIKPSTEQIANKHVVNEMTQSYIEDLGYDLQMGDKYYESSEIHVSDQVKDSSHASPIRIVNHVVPSVDEIEMYVNLSAFQMQDHCQISDS